MYRAALGLLVAAAFAACSSGDSGDADVAAWEGPLPITAPWLRERLPPGVAFYTRVPHVLGLLAIPKGNAMSTALASEANIRNVVAIQQGLEDNVLGELPLFANPLFEVLLSQLRSPIELAVFGAQAPGGLVAMTLKARTNAEVEQLFAELSQVVPVGLAGPLNGEGVGELVGSPAPAFVRFEAASGRLLLAAGLAVTATSLDVLSAAPSEHPMHALEQRIDSSGQGLFGWLDLAQALQMGQAFAPPEVTQAIAAAGLGNARALAFGAGVANGKGRMSLLLDVGTNRGARPFPVFANAITATAVGEPDAALLLSLPSAEELARLEALFLGPAPGPTHPWIVGKNQIRAIAGFGIEDVLGAIGPEVIFVFDAAGDYSALRVRNQALFDDLLNRVATATGSAPEQRELLSTTFNHWRMPTSFSTGPPAAAPDVGEMGDVLTLLGRIGEHTYWIRDGDYVYASSVPQPLMDRVRAGAEASLAEWFAERQRIDPSASLFAAAGSVPKLPTRMYHGYLGLLQSAGDLTDADYDIWAMPTADQLGLADRSTLGLTVNLGEPYVSIELTYDSHPLEVLLGGGGLSSVAVIGILAAIAIPAYQDYTIRAQVTEGLNLAAAAKAAVAEDFLNEGAPPTNRSDAGLEGPPAFTSGRYTAGIDVTNGAITILFGNEANAAISGGTLTITPYVAGDGSVAWRCGNAEAPLGARPMGNATTHEPPTIEPKYLPSACR